MSYLSILYNRLSNMEQEREKLLKELDIQNSRKLDIEKIISDINNKSVDYISGINKDINNIVEYNIEAIKLNCNISKVSNQIENEKEKYPDSDSNLVVGIFNLEREVRQVCNKIVELSNKLGDLNIEISTIEGNISTENRRIVEEENQRVEKQREERQREEKQKEEKQNKEKEKEDKQKKLKNYFIL